MDNERKRRSAALSRKNRALAEHVKNAKLHPVLTPKYQMPHQSNAKLLTNTKTRRIASDATKSMNSCMEQGVKVDVLCVSRQFLKQWSYEDKTEPACQLCLATNPRRH